MPSKIHKRGKKKFYRRPDGAYIKVKGHFKKVGADKYSRRKHYSKRTPSSDKKGVHENP